MSSSARPRLAKFQAYEIREAGREPASAFYARLANDCGSDAAGYFACTLLAEEQALALISAQVPASPARRRAGWRDRHARNTRPSGG